MEISSNLVGTHLKPYSAQIHWRDTMNYAAAIFDSNPLFFDDEQDGGVLVHPMFSVAVTWPIVEQLSQYLDAADIPFEVLVTQVHYTEHLIFHRPIRPDGKLTVNTAREPASSTFPAAGNRALCNRQTESSIPEGQDSDTRFRPSS